MKYGNVKRSINSAKKKQAEANAALNDAISKIEDLYGIDLQTIPSKAENSDNVYEAICCYVQYGEYDIDSIIEEIETEWKKRGMAKCASTIDRLLSQRGNGDERCYTNWR